MGQKLHNRIELWKKQLLDFGKRNRLINFVESKRSCVKIISPLFEKLWDLVVNSEQEIIFSYARNIEVDDNGEETYEVIINGNVETNLTLGELQKTLKTLRYKANTSLEERGINTLYLTFGILKWTEKDDSSYEFSSPIILVPVKLLIESITSPYRLSLHDDEIVINPTLSHKLENDFGIKLPDFDSTHDSIVGYLGSLRRIIDNRWRLEQTVFLTNLSFLKINMYNDLERNEEKLNSNHVIASLVGEESLLQVPKDLNNYNHDQQLRPIDTFHVVDADSYQQDAVILSKNGISFVLQGPPGTGKSQTITNIIADALANGKKVLFVSEKMAALQVVHNRLASVGLADFCLTLHSHKANKKEILRNLDNSIRMDHFRVKEEALAQLDLLERKRALLNEYQNELHTTTSPLNCTIYTVFGKLAALENVPDIVFDIPDIALVTPDILNERIFSLSEFSKTIGNRSNHFTDNVWKDSTIKFISNAFRHELDSIISKALPILKDLKELHTSICIDLDIEFEPTLNHIYNLISLLTFAAESPIIPAEWVMDLSLDISLDKAISLKLQLENVIAIKESLSVKYRESFFHIDAQSVKKQLYTLMCQLQELFNGADTNWIVQNIDKQNSRIQHLFKDVNQLFKVAKLIASKLGIETPETITQLNDFANITQLLFNIARTHPTHKWFDSSERTRIKSQLSKCKSLHNSVLELQKNILSRFDKEILEWDFYPVLQRFRSTYQPIHKYLNPQYYKDLKQLNRFSNSEKISFNEAFDVLNLLKKLADQKSDISNYSDLLSNDFGLSNECLYLQWDILHNRIEVFENSISNLSMEPDLMNSFIHDQTSINEIYQFISQYTKTEPLLNSNLSDLLHDFNKDLNWSVIGALSEHLNLLSSDFLSEYDKLMKMSYSSCSYDELIHDLDNLISFDELNNRISAQKDEIVSLYKDFYAGIDTNWDSLIKALNYASELRGIIAFYNLPKHFIYKICTDSKIISYCSDKSKSLSILKNSLVDSITWFTSLFKNGADFLQLRIDDLSNRMYLCMINKSMLEEWVDHCSSRERCLNIGLDNYIYQIEASDIDSVYIKDAYLKRFYNLWLDHVLPQFPAVQSFRRRIHEQNIDDFCNLDKVQFKIAQARVKERVIRKIPDLNSINEARDEIAILKREINKQRRLMPLRKLFTAIPNLITSLRPCFMMSPLSVSVFLEAKFYNFDLVIFDEASQVHTEDAIGAIMRGKQVIIVGDTKQLPPTNFFANALNDEEFDIDNNDSNDEKLDVFESILDEAMTVLPERSLRWHYRSRHEHLIAFSNIKIYNNRLITFPSSTEKSPNLGVEYIYVENGVYDRGGKKNNIIEARHVADLVFEHFKTTPNRSLGVVTFSESQQNAIEAALRQKRLQNPQYDNYFMEDTEEPFFIKNLENIQGDERDTIIFSIGYAKDNRGIMYMNFGPLSREGGFRRLNVAITRAKYNVKLVGSINPSDIDLDKVSSDGVRMLRSYIEFAQQGIKALERELLITNDLNFDSPFEEAIYNFLHSKGYNIVTQVGCSGFRIDMAIKHPSQSGKYIIGIECDGASYHSSRTARERDRLRQTVLEEMGWKIYRIWSTDWIKDPKIEGERLVEAIEKALLLYNNISDATPIQDDNSSRTALNSPEFEFEEKVENSNENINRYGFELYDRADLSSIKTYGDMSDVIWAIISIEQPIHFDELCRRIAPAFERQKATSIVRGQVRSIIKNQLAELVTEDIHGHIFLADFTDLKVRIPNPNDDYIRPINIISSEELQLALKTIIQYSFGITPPDLFYICAREFGFRRTGENINRRLRYEYEELLINGEIAENDGKVYLS